LLDTGRFDIIGGVDCAMLLRALTYRERSIDVLLTGDIAGGRDGVFNMQEH